MPRPFFFVSFCCLAIFLVVGGRPCDANDKIVWPYVCYPPLYICEEEKLTAGVGLEIYQLLWKNLPDYAHELAKMPVSRIVQFSEQGEQVLFYGLYKTQEREKALHFSLPCRISPPTFLVVRKEDVARFGGGAPQSLQTLLENKSLTFLLLYSISFGKGIDEILTSQQRGPHILTEYNTENMGQKSLQLLSNKRVDYTLSLDATLHDAKTMGLLDTIAFIPIKEQGEYALGYVTAPKTIWGQQMIEKINRILQKEIPTEAFFNYFVPLVDKELVPDLRKEFNKKIVLPVTTAGE